MSDLDIAVEVGIHDGAYFNTVEMYGCYVCRFVYIGQN